MKNLYLFDSPFSNNINKKGVTQIEIVTSGDEKDRVSLLKKFILYQQNSLVYNGIIY